MDIFKLVGSVFVDTEEANNSLSKTDDKASNVGKTLSNATKKAGEFALGIGAAAAGAVTGLIGVASSAASTADTIDKASQRMDISVESYQELSHAASLCGVEMSTMEKAAKKLEGTELNFDDAIAEIYSLETAEERSSKAAELFGDAVAYQMSPMLNASAEDMASMRQEAHDLGLVLDEDSVVAGAQLNDALSKVKDSIGALGTNIGAALMPILTDLCDQFIDFLPTLTSLADEIGPVLIDVLEQLGPPLFEVIEKILPPLIQLIEALLPLFLQICDIIIPILTALINGLVKLITKVVIPAITKLVNNLKTAIDKIVTVFNNLKAKIMPIINVIKGAITSAVTNVVNAFKTAKTTIKSVFDTLVEIIKKPINSVIGMINKMIDAMNALSFDVPDWVPVIGGNTFGFDLKHIPELATGGTITGAGSAIVGEAGAELIDLPSGAQVTPLKNDTLHTEEILVRVEQLLSELKEMPYAIASAMENANIQAVIDGSDVFNSVRKSWKEYKYQFGKNAFV